MYSPYEAVYGFDRTHIKRLSLQEYMHERDAPLPTTTASADNASATTNSSLTIKGAVSEALRSRDPNVQFYSKYPLHDRFGSELCVLYQILEMEVQQEMRRVEQGGDMTRKSGVRLSTEITFDDTTEESSVPILHQQKREQNQGSSVYRPTPFVAFPLGNVDDNDDIDVSASSNQFSAVAVSSPQDTQNTRQTSRGSSFSIYRDSRLNSCVKSPGTWSVNIHQPPPLPAPPQQQQQQQSKTVVSNSQHSGTFTSKRFLENDVNANMVSSTETSTNLPLNPPPPQRSSTASPMQFGNGETLSPDDVVGATRETLDTTAGTDPLRFTTVRPSEFRTTKQLFLPGRITVMRRTVEHAKPIPTQAYGFQSETIPASIVAPLIAANLEVHCSSGDFCDIDGITPHLIPGAEVVLGERRCRILRYHTSSDVYEAYECGDTPVQESGTTPLQVLLYRWSIRAVQQQVNESYRAALGLSLVAPAVTVAGYRYRDGGLTAIILPAGYRAIPLSTVPLSERSFPTCVKLMLRMLSDLVVKRTIHGNLRGLNQLFFAIRTPGSSSDMPVALLIPVHWEKLIDFSMFVDRNAGRTIPMIDDDGGTSKGTRIYHSQDVSMVVSLLLENELSQHLQQSQLGELHRLMMMTTEPTQVANYLIQLKNTMTVMPSDMNTLYQEYETTLQCLS
ncbi:hypothetical protein LSM04_006785 [Trypanosoma melophagium]|uniref:uncharacterized protein n=1 Tax=Trypanosoma melophagium TaxID=715481 RepID=UPI00351A899B|nr:hypothetical protein LSM04_006785 [Trypanosoma melophagium]